MGAEQLVSLPCENATNLLLNQRTPSPGDIAEQVESLAPLDVVVLIAGLPTKFLYPSSCMHIAAKLADIS